MKRVGSFLADAWQPFIFAVVGIALCCFVYLFRSGTLTAGYSTQELTSLSSASSGKRLLDDPTSLPYKLGHYALFKLDRTSVRYTRAVSSSYAVLSIVLFYYIIRRWHTTRVALLTTIIFASSSWLLHVGRSATPDVLLIFFPLLLVASGVYIRRSRHDVIALHFGAAVAAFCMYIPFASIFVLAAMVWRAPSFFKGKNKPVWWLQITSTTLFLTLCSPLIYALVREPGLIRQLLLLPSSMPTISQLWNNVVSISLALPFRTLGLTPSQWLGQLPILDIACFILLILGIYSYITIGKLQRARILFITLFFSLVAVAISGNLSNLSLIIPTLYVFISGGITYLLKEWYTVFPKNPIARSVGTTTVTVLVVLICFYHVNRYFIAWPLNTQTRGAFTNISVLK